MVLDARDGLNAGGHVHQCRPHHPHGLRHALGRQAAGEAEADARRAFRQGLPPPAHAGAGAGVEERQTALRQPAHALPVDFALDRDAPDDALAEGLEEGVGLVAVQLDPVQVEELADPKHLGERRVEEHTDPLRTGQIADPRRSRGIERARGAGPKHEAEQVGPGVERRRGVLTAGDAADLDQHGHAVAGPARRRHPKRACCPIRRRTACSGLSERTRCSPTRKAW